MGQFSHLGQCLTQLALVITCLAGQGRAEAGDIQLIFPDNNVSSKPIIEFRARDGIPGHAFIALGREIDNGTTVFDSIVGFYPQADGRIGTIKNVLHGPGQIDYRLPDLHSDVVFKTHITEEQLSSAKAIISRWSVDNYSFFGQNCVHLSQAVAVAIGLTPPRADLRFPGAFIVNLQKLNPNASSGSVAVTNNRPQFQTTPSNNHRSPPVIIDPDFGLQRNTGVAGGSRPSEKTSPARGEPTGGPTQRPTETKPNVDVGTSPHPSVPMQPRR